MNHLGTVPLITPRLVLRRFRLNDAKAMFKHWANDPRVTQFLCWPPHQTVDVSRGVIEEWVAAYKEPDHYQWAITLKDSGKLIGSIAAVSVNDPVGSVHIGYCISYEQWHKGYTSEALQELIRFFFEQVGVNRVEARHDPRNPHSGKVMQKCGMTYEGTLRQCELNQSGLCDAAFYGILASEYRSIRF